MVNYDLTIWRDETKKRKAYTSEFTAAAVSLKIWNLERFAAGSAEALARRTADAAEPHRLRLVLNTIALL